MRSAKRLLCKLVKILCVTWIFICKMWSEIAFGILEFLFGCIVHLVGGSKMSSGCIINKLFWKFQVSIPREAETTQIWKICKIQVNHKSLTSQIHVSQSQL